MEKATGAKAWAWGSGGCAQRPACGSLWLRVRFAETSTETISQALNSRGRSNTCSLASCPFTSRAVLVQLHICIECLYQKQILTLKCFLVRRFFFPDWRHRAHIVIIAIQIDTGLQSLGTNSEKLLFSEITCLSYLKGMIPPLPSVSPQLPPSLSPFFFPFREDWKHNQGLRLVSWGFG